MDDITSIALHPDMQTVATGEIGPRPLIQVWRFSRKSFNKITTIKGGKKGLQKGVCALAFSPKGKYLAAAAIDTDHYVAVYNP